jgi:DNA repair exonuclease SbcCD ATPase subunit
MGDRTFEEAVIAWTSHFEADLDAAKALRDEVRRSGGLPDRAKELGMTIALTPRRHRCKHYEDSRYCPYCAQEKHAEAESEKERKQLQAESEKERKKERKQLQAEPETERKNERKRLQAELKVGRKQVHGGLEEERKQLRAEFKAERKKLQTELREKNDKIRRQLGAIEFQSAEIERLRRDVKNLQARIAKSAKRGRRER